MQRAICRILVFPQVKLIKLRISFYSFFHCFDFVGLRYKKKHSERCRNVFNFMLPR